MAGLWRKPCEQYDGLQVHCAPGVHAAAADMLRRHNVTKSGVLDLGAGSGAFLARLRDEGYQDLHAIERDPSAFRLGGIVPLNIDLQSDFSARVGRRFSLIAAIEIIEHLESPLHLLRSTAALLEPGGHLLLSTPNLAEWKSRVKLLLKGELRYFGLADYAFQRHISPIVPQLLPKLLEEANLRPVEMTTAGSFQGPLSKAIFAPLSLPFGAAGHGDCILVLAVK